MGHFASIRHTLLPLPLLLAACGAPAVVASHAVAPAASPATFTGQIVHPPGARLRSGPGLDQAVIDIEPVGRVETFDGWFRRQDDTPMTDEITGKIEAWSRDWLHLADGRGWVHSSSVKGMVPDGMAQRAWTPTAPPSPRAGLIEIPIQLQEHPVTCEVASLRMALAGRGIATSEEALLSVIGVDRRPAQVDGGGAVVQWGDPNRTFVGDPDGHITQHTGYGVYSGPIARAAAAEGATVLAAGTGIAPAAIYGGVIQGHPSVAWVTSEYRRSTVATWRAWDGASIDYTLDEHAVLVIGVTPAQVLIDDPFRGQIWVAKTQFESAYATFGDMAVTIR
jgi:uncharacterized protein YvpB